MTDELLQQLQTPDLPTQRISPGAKLITGNLQFPIAKHAADLGQ